MDQPFGQVTPSGVVGDPFFVESVSVFAGCAVGAAVGDSIALPLRDNLRKCVNITAHWPNRAEADARFQVFTPSVTFSELRECSAKDTPRPSYEIKNLHSRRHRLCLGGEPHGSRFRAASAVR